VGFLFVIGVTPFAKYSLAFVAPLLVQSAEQSLTFTIGAEDRCLH